MHINHLLCFLLQGLHTRCEVAFEDLVSDLEHDGDHHVVEEVVALRIGEERIPEAYAVGHIKILAHDEHHPAEGVELRVDVLGGEFLVDGRVDQL